MARIFISYRRDDAPHAAGRIADHLTRQLGDQSVFRDVVVLEAIVDHAQWIMNEIPNSDVLLAIIGSNFPLSPGRLFDEEESLRQELEHAVRLRVPIIPVLIDEASMPEEDRWPESLRPVARLGAMRVRDSDFTDDFERLLTAIRQYEGKKLVDLPVPNPSSPVTGEHLALINSSWRTPIYDAQYPGHEMYRFDVILAGNPIVLARVEKVVYVLPTQWSTGPKDVDSKTPLFGLKELAWADLLLRARVYIQNQSDPVYLSSWVRLTQEGTNLVPSA